MCIYKFVRMSRVNRNGKKKVAPSPRRLYVYIFLCALLSLSFFFFFFLNRLSTVCYFYNESTNVNIVFFPSECVYLMLNYIIHRLGYMD